MAKTFLQSVPVDFVINGQVTDDAVDYTIERIDTVLRRIDEPILFMRLKLSRSADPAHTRPVTAQVTLDVNGYPVRAQVAAADVREAADRLQRRLNDQFEQLAERRATRRVRRGVGEPGHWRHGDVPTDRPDYFARPVDEREVVKRKTFAPGELTVDEALFDMDQMDFDFYLFREAATGDDAVIEQLPDGTVRLTRLRRSDVDASPASVPVTLAGAVPPRVSLDEAIGRLDESGDRFLFFADAATGRGHVLYRRYDGHYGLITPL